MATSQANGGAQKNGLHGLNGHGGVEAKVKGKAGDEKTDRTRWRLEDDRGCQIWHYLESDEEVAKWPQSVADKWYLGMETVGSPLSASPYASGAYDDASWACSLCQLGWR